MVSRIFNEKNNFSSPGFHASKRLGWIEAPSRSGMAKKAVGHITKVGLKSDVVLAKHVA